MPLTNLKFNPGVNREITSYSNTGGWFECDKIRFDEGYPKKIGGWQRYSTSSFLGSGRALMSWSALDGSNYLGLGTNLKYYIVDGGEYYDITPIRFTTSAGDVTFSATDGSSTITVSDTNHGAFAGDFVTFSGAVSLGGTITADILNQEYAIVTIVDGNSYTIEARTVSTIGDITVDGVLTPTLVTANSSDTGNGGASVIGAYQVNSGLDTTLQGTGWGADTWGSDTWGTGADLTVSGDVLRLWMHHNFGEDLLYNVMDAGIYYWDATGGTGVRGVALSDVSGADATTPTVAHKIIVSDNARHVIAFGCDPENNIGTQDPLLIRFSSSESLTQWQSLPTNSAGDLRIGSGSKIVDAIETRQQILVFTDTSVHSMQYLGAPFTFGITQISENTTIVSPNAAVAVDDAVFWMGKGEFFVYTGQIIKLPCTLRTHVFDNFNYAQAEKVTSGLNSEYSEAWWFYPSADSDNLDSYIIYNYLDKVWYYGSLTRTAWIDRGTADYPIAASDDGYLYYHEFGQDDGSQNPPVAVESFIESSQISIGEGDRFISMTRLLPDITFEGSSASTPAVTFTLKARNYPGGNYLQSDSGDTTRTAAVPVEQFTNQIDVRLRGRSFAIKIESDETGVGWQLGTPRVDIRTDGRR